MEWNNKGPFDAVKEMIANEFNKLEELHPNATDSPENMIQYVKQAEKVSEALLNAEHGVVLIATIGIDLLSAAKKGENRFEDNSTN